MWGQKLQVLKHIMIFMMKKQYIIVMVKLKKGKFISDPKPLEIMNKINKFKNKILNNFMSLYVWWN